MAKKGILHRDVLNRISELEYADIVVGVPSFRNASTIRHVVSTSCQGMRKYFPRMKGVFVNSDGGSEDNTRQVVLDTRVPKEIEKIVTPYIGIKGKGTAFRTIFEIADRLKAKALVVLDSDLRSVTPEWIKLMAEPIIKLNFGYVVPLYRRHKYDGTITNSIAYPLTRTLYGLNVRQPIAGDFGITGALCKYYSHLDIYDDPEIAKFGIDIFMTTTAICEGFRICQTYTGSKIHDPKDPGSDLKAMFFQVVGTLFKLMKKYEVKWQALNEVREAERFGEELPTDVPEVNVNYEGLIERFITDFQDHKTVLKSILNSRSYTEFLRLSVALGQRGGSKSGETLNLLQNAPLNWAHTVFDFAIGYHFSGLEPATVTKALLPLYYIKVAKFVAITKNMSYKTAEREIFREALEFETEKPYLIRKWTKATSRAKNMIQHQSTLLTDIKS